MKTITVNGQTKYKSEDGRIFPFMTLCILWEAFREMHRSHDIYENEEYEAWKAGEIDL